VSNSFALDDVDDLTTGTVGEPGQRVFYLQARQGAQVVTLRLEKTQVAALCEYLAAMLADLPPSPVDHDAGDLVEPVVAEWVVGTMGVSYDEAADRILVLAQELLADAEDTEPEGEPAEARMRATRAQVAAFIRRGQGLVAAGRPPCPLCGGPLDPEGHTCVRLNGHRGLRR